MSRHLPSLKPLDELSLPRKLLLRYLKKRKLARSTPKTLNWTVSDPGEPIANDYLLIDAVLTDGVKARPRSSYSDRFTEPDPPDTELRQALRDTILPHIGLDKVPMSDCIRRLSAEAERLSEGGTRVGMVFLDVRRRKPVPETTDGREEDDALDAEANGQERDAAGLGELAEGADGFGTPLDEGAFPEGTITMDVDNIPLGEVIRYLCMGSGRRYHVEDDRVVVAHKELPLAALFTETSTVRRGVLDFRRPDQEAAEDWPHGFVSRDVRGFFMNFGVSFPAGARAFYDPRTSALTVRNTPENLRRLSKVLTEISVIPVRALVRASVVDITDPELAGALAGDGRRMHPGETLLSLLRTGVSRPGVRLVATGEVLGLGSSDLEAKQGTSGTTQTFSFSGQAAVMSRGYAIELTPRISLAGTEWSTDGLAVRDGQCVALRWPSAGDHYLVVHTTFVAPDGSCARGTLPDAQVEDAAQNESPASLQARCKALRFIRCRVDAVGLPELVAALGAHIHQTSAGRPPLKVSLPDAPEIIDKDPTPYGLHLADVSLTDILDSLCFRFGLESVWTQEGVVLGPAATMSAYYEARFYTDEPGWTVAHGPRKFLEDALDGDSTYVEELSLTELARREAGLDIGPGAQCSWPSRHGKFTVYSSAADLEAFERYSLVVPAWTKNVRLACTLLQPANPTPVRLDLAGGVGRSMALTLPAAEGAPDLRLQLKINETWRWPHPIPVSWTLTPLTADASPAAPPQHGKALLEHGVPTTVTLPRPAGPLTITARILTPAGQLPRHPDQADLARRQREAAATPLRRWLATTRLPRLRLDQCGLRDAVAALSAAFQKDSPDGQGCNLVLSLEKENTHASPEPDERLTADWHDLTAGDAVERVCAHFRVPFDVAGSVVFIGEGKTPNDRQYLVVPVNPQKVLPAGTVPRETETFNAVLKESLEADGLIFGKRDRIRYRPRRRVLIAYGRHRFLVHLAEALRSRQQTP